MIVENKVSDFVIDPDKYIVIKTDIFKAFNEQMPKDAQELARLIQKHPESVIFYHPDSEDEFFVMMVKDIHSRPGLIGYARSAAEYGKHVLASAISTIAERSGILSKYVKHPD